MTSKHIKRFLIIVSMLFISMVSTAGLFTAQAKADEIKIAELNWPSGTILAHIDTVILKIGYGHKVEIVPGGTEATITSMLATESPNIFSEAWTSFLGAGYDEAVAEGKLLTASIGVIEGAGEGFYVPDYVLEAHPELTSFEKVLEHPELFPHPEDATKGGIAICPDGWACQMQHQNLFEAFDMEAKGWKLINPGSGVGLDAAWTGAVTKKENFFGYYWSPTLLVGKLGLSKLPFETEFAGQENWECITLPDDECIGPKPSAYPETIIATVVTSGLHPDVMVYLSKRQMPGDVLNTLLIYSNDNQASPTDVAIEFLKSHKETWSKWVTPEAAEKLGLNVTLD